MNAHDTIAALHTAYCSITGYEIRFNMDFEHLWFDFYRQGFTEEDLKLVIAYLRKIYFKRQDILLPCLRLHRLIGDTMRFAEYLAESKKIIRVREEISAKESVLRATGRTAEKEIPARTAAEIMRDGEAFRKFTELKKAI